MSEKVIDEYGAERWYLNGKLHREDGPAVVWPDGTQACVKVEPKQ